MGVDFSKLVLGPCMNTFAVPVTVLPVKSQPTVSSYTNRGIWTIDNISVPMEDGGTFSSKVLKLGIKLDDYAISPEQYDVIRIKAKDLPMGYLADQLNPTANVDFVVDNDQPDGQGGTVLILKRKP